MEGAKKDFQPFRKLRSFLMKRSCGIRIRTISTSRQLKEAYEYERGKVISDRMTKQLQRCPKKRKRRFLRYPRKTRTELKAERKKILKDDFMILSQPPPSALKSKPSISRVDSPSRFISVSTFSYFVHPSDHKIQALSDGITPQKLQISTTKKSRFAIFVGSCKQKFRFVRSKSGLIVGALKAKVRLYRHAHVQQNQAAGSSRNVQFNRVAVHSSRRLEKNLRVLPQTTGVPRTFSFLPPLRSWSSSVSVGHGASATVRITENQVRARSTSSRSSHRNSSKSVSESGDNRHAHSSGSSKGSSHSSSAVYKQRFRYKAFGKSWISWLRSWRCKYYRRESCFGNIPLSLLRLWRR